MEFDFNGSGALPFYLLFIHQDSTLRLNKMSTKQQDQQSKRKGNDQEPIQSNFTSYPKLQTRKEHKERKIKTVRAKSQENSSFLADGQRAVLNKMKYKQKADEHRQLE